MYKNENKNIIYIGKETKQKKSVKEKKNQFVHTQLV